MVQILAVGAPAQVRATFPVRPVSELSARGKVADVPLVTVTLVAPFAARLKSMPVPLKLTVCVPLGALSVSTSEPVREPAVVGANSTTKSQALPTPSEVPQVLEAIAKSPLIFVAAKASGRPPLLVRVMVCVGESSPTPVPPKLMVDGDSETPGGATPVPFRITVW